MLKNSAARAGQRFSVRVSGCGGLLMAAHLRTACQQTWRSSEWKKPTVLGSSPEVSSSWVLNIAAMGLDVPVPRRAWGRRHGFVERGMGMGMVAGEVLRK